MTLFSKAMWLALLVGLLSACSHKPQEATITLYCTTDVHGSIFNFDLKENKDTDHSLSNLSQFLKDVKQDGKKEYILLDGGDFLQGQPSNYYSNFIDTGTMNLASKVMNYLEYDVAAVGNHDIEAGHKVYDKVKGEFQFPWLAANIIDLRTGQPYFKPYTVIFRKGIKIVVFGMITPGIPKWLPRHLWSGMEFMDMVETAKRWVPKIQEEEKPDLLVGLFHSGFDYTYGGENEHTPGNENAGMLVARKVEGFDVVILGHDHQEKVELITNDVGQQVQIIDSRSHAQCVGKVTVHLKKKEGKYLKKYKAELIDLGDVEQDPEYNLRFQPELEKVKNYIDTRIGTFTEAVSGREGMFGPSAFTDLIHDAQLACTGADISFSTILQRDAQIDKGTITIRDMFNLYKYENGLYTMKFTGEEIHRYLEYAYGLQYNTMRSPNDHLLNFQLDKKGNPVRGNHGNYLLVNDFFNFSCAAGIRYTVDVSKTPGHRIKIHSMSDGTPFDTDRTYSVAINSYRGNGGGGHLTKGVGLTKEEMLDRIVSIRENDVRYYISEYIKTHNTLTPACRNDWKVVPEAWFKAGKEQDCRLLYP